jgi:hypothetical protein
MNLRGAPFSLSQPLHSIPDILGETLEVFLSEYPRQKSICLISGFIGDELPRVRPSPLPRELSFFWANKNEWKEIVENAGWTFLWDDSFEGDPANPVDASIRSKHFKFLQFLQENTKSSIQHFRYVMWADSRRIPVSRTAFFDFLFARPDDPRLLPGITIRTTPPLKETLESEIQAAMGQPRYAKTMDQVRQVIREEMETNGAREEVRICNTGLILFDTANPRVQKLNNLIVENVLKTRNPECQIFFALLRQRFDDNLIFVVPYEAFPSILFD